MDKSIKWKFCLDIEVSSTDVYIPVVSLMSFLFCGVYVKHKKSVIQINSGSLVFFKFFLLGVTPNRSTLIQSNIFSLTIDPFEGQCL